MLMLFRFHFLFDDYFVKVYIMFSSKYDCKYKPDWRAADHCRCSCFAMEFGVEVIARK